MLRGNIPSIQIAPMDNGWIVNAGCLSLVFEDSNKLGIEVLRFLANPEQVTREYTEKYNRERDPGVRLRSAVAADMTEMMRGREAAARNRVVASYDEAGCDSAALSEFPSSAPGLGVPRTTP